MRHTLEGKLPEGVCSVSRTDFEMVRCPGVTGQRQDVEHRGGQKHKLIGTAPSPLGNPVGPFLTYGPRYMQLTAETGNPPVVPINRLGAGI